MLKVLQKWSAPVFTIVPRSAVQFAGASGNETATSSFPFGPSLKQRSPAPTGLTGTGSSRTASNHAESSLPPEGVMTGAPPAAAEADEQSARVMVAGAAHRRRSMASSFGR